MANGINSNVSSQNDSKTRLDCVPKEKWNKMRWTNKKLDVVCMSKDYEVDTAPKEIAEFPFTFKYNHMGDTTIMDIDEKKRTITIEISLLSTWYDERTKAVFSDNSGSIWLPPLTTGKKSAIWNPFNLLEIRKLKKREYMLDPIIAKLGFMGSEVFNKYSKILSADTLLADEDSLVWSDIQWRVTVSCLFKFRDFPFDEHKCSLEMVLPFSNITVYNYPGEDIMINELHGFDIQSQKIGTSTRYDWVQEFHVTTFGLDVHIKRQISTYILQYYLPSITVVITSSISFIIPLSAIPGRVALVVTQFLTLTNIFIH